MVSITLSVSPELKKKMDSFDYVNWSAVARESIEKRIDMLEKFREFTKESTLTEEDALEIGAKINAGLAKRYKKIMSSNRC